MISLSKEQIAEKLATIIWDYKVGDNIAYNFRQLYFLYSKKNIEGSSEKKKLYNKHLSITIVSLIEAILYDFLVRLSDSTNHFPDTISEQKRKLIKERLNNEKQWFRSTNRIRQRYKRVKNYSLTEVKNFLREYDLIGVKGAPIYEDLEEAIFLRNRIHIFNWFGNLERDDNRVFTDTRLERIEKNLVGILNSITANYPRPFHSGQTSTWLKKMEND